MNNKELLKINKEDAEKLLEEEKVNLSYLKQELEEVSPNDKPEIQKITSEINKELFIIRRIESIIENLREIIPDDVKERKMIINSNYVEEVDQAVPDNIPLVFHGNQYIGIVEDIIRSGGLFGPKDRGMATLSYAGRIDVTAKTNIEVSLEFADSGNYCNPYGAIFVFLPKEYEYESVFRTGKSTLVNSGVESISFRENPDRLMAIITTNENIERLKKVAIQSGMDENRIMTHRQFIDLCKQMYDTFTRK